MRILGKYALVLIQHGTGVFADANGTERPFNPGDVLLVFPEIPHAYGPVRGSSWQHAYVVFEGPQFDLLRASEVLDPANPIWHLEPLDYWRRRLEEIFQAAPRHSKTAAIRKLGQFNFLLTDMAATNAEAHQHPMDDWLEESMQLLSGISEDGWPTPQTIAQRVGLSYESFRKRFVKQTGEAPAKFQKRRRIEHACAAIYQNSHTFKELADEFGFCDVFHFSKAFRQIVGDTPSAFRKKARGE